MLRVREMDFAVVATFSYISFKIIITSLFISAGNINTSIVDEAFLNVLIPTSPSSVLTSTIFCNLTLRLLFIVTFFELLFRVSFLKNPQYIWTSVKVSCGSALLSLLAVCLALFSTVNSQVVQVKLESVVGSQTEGLENKTQKIIRFLLLFFVNITMTPLMCIGGLENVVLQN